MSCRTCPGLPGNWINAWLAAVGATVLDPRIRLHWTTGGTPAAVLSADAVDPFAALAESWPDRPLLEHLPIAEHWGATAPLPRKVPVDAFAQRAKAARCHPFSWTLSSTLTDLQVDKNGEVSHARFDPGGPGTIKWLHHRLLKVHKHAGEPTVEQLAGALAVPGIRVLDNGLGFDITRLGSLADSSEKYVNPVVEVLAFFGFAILPVRGRGTDQRLTPSVKTRATQRGWLQDGRDRRFLWPAWSHRLDALGIDALMDVWMPERKKTWRLLGVHAGWRVVPYESRGSGDRTQAFGSEPL